MREHLVVVIPGIGGSVLVDAAGQEAWSVRPNSLADLLRRPEQLSIEVNPELTPRGLITSLKPLPMWTVIPGYEKVLRQLGRLEDAVVDDGTGPRNPAANVVAYGYDFRLGVEAAADRLDGFIRERLNLLWPIGPAQSEEQRHHNRVLIIAHSMGGLVARHWAGRPENRSLCRAMMTLGTPHRGAPKALDVLVNGLPVAGGLGHISPKDTMRVVRQWQSVYDLLPRFPMVAAIDARLAGSAAQPDAQLLRPHELSADRLPSGWDDARATQAHQLHQRIQDWWERDMPSRERPEMVPRIGYGHGTPRRGTWDGRRLRITRGPFDGRNWGIWNTDLGDGTVPAISGLPIELTDHVPVELRQKLRHGPIGTLDTAADWANKYEDYPRNLHVETGESPDTNQHPVVLGMDVEGLAVVGQPVPIAARVLGVPEAVREATRDAAVFAVVKPVRHAAPRQVVQLAWDAEAETFGAEVSDLVPGLYSVTVSCDAIPGGGSQETTETTEVLADADLD